MRSILTAYAHLRRARPQHRLIPPAERPVRRSPWKTARALGFLGVVGSALVSPGPSEAQSFDFPVIPRGAFAAEVEATFLSLDSRFRAGDEGGRSSEPLGAPWSDPEMGVALLPQLVSAEEQLRALTEDPGFRLRLGAGQVRLAADEIRFPFRLSYGLTSRITLSATVPVYRQRIDASHGFSPEGANVGGRPATGELDPFLSGFEEDLEATRARATELCDEMGDEDPDCLDALGLADDAEAFLNGFEQLAQEAVFPLEGSPPGDALNAWFQEIRAGMEGLEIEPGAPVLPLADAPLDGAALRSLFIEPLYGPGGPPLEPFTNIWLLGDVEAALTVALVDLRRSDAENGAPLRLRSAAGIRYRFPTAEPDTMRNYVEFEAHRGHPELELRSVNDLTWGGRAGLRADVTLSLPGSADVRRRVAAVDEPLDPAPPTRVLSWQPGRAVQLDLAPRLALTSELALSGRYSYFSRGEESFEPAAGEQAVNVRPLVEGSAVSLHRAGLELAYSTLEAWQEERASIPFEIRAGWRRGISGTGERLPRADRIHTGLRIFIPR